MIDWSMVYLAAEWTVRGIMLIVVTQRQRPPSALAWLVGIFFLPWVGLVFYFLVGENRLPLRRTQQRLIVDEKLKLLGDRFRGHPHIEHPELKGNAATVVHLAEKLGSLPILGNNSITLIDDTDEMIDRLVADIDAATHHVHLLYYIFADDQTGRRVADALERAARRGVQCRLLVDAVGSRRMYKSLGPRLQEAGVDVRLALPVNLWRRQAARLDLRNHRKLAIIDGLIGYAGSQNIVNADYGHKDLAWLDLSVRLEGPILLELQVVFSQDWFFETSELLADESVFPDPVVKGDVAVQTLPSGPIYPTENYQRLVVAAIHGATRRVVITTPYLVPDEPTLQAMQTAVLRGVRVQVIVPERCDQVLVGAASRGYYELLLEAGIELYLYQDGLLHAKTILIDDTISLIGTSNFDIRSFAINFELNLMFFGAETAKSLDRLIAAWLAKSNQLTSSAWAERPFLVQTAENVARLFSPVL